MRSSCAARGTLRPMARSLGAAGDDILLRNAVNTKLPHAISQGVERQVFAHADEASTALKALTDGINKVGTFPVGTCAALIVSPGHGAALCRATASDTLAGNLSVALSRSRPLPACRAPSPMSAAPPSPLPPSASAPAHCSSPPPGPPPPERTRSSPGRRAHRRRSPLRHLHWRSRQAHPPGGPALPPSPRPPLRIVLVFWVLTFDNGSTRGHCATWSPAR